MATFYLLPPRTALEEALGRFLSSWLPGLRGPIVSGGRLAELIQEHLAERDVFVVFREDLPDGADAERALRDGFGAEFGDEIIELRQGGDERVASRCWRIGALAAA